MNEIFSFVENNTYNLRNGLHLSRVNLHSTQYGTESLGNLGAKTWNLVPVHMKDFKALSTFKNQRKNWIPKDCPCCLCKVYVAQAGFLQKLLRLFCFLQWNPILLVLFIHSVLVFFGFTLLISLFVLLFHLCYLCIFILFLFMYLSITYLFIHLFSFF